MEDWAEKSSNSLNKKIIATVLHLSPGKWACTLLTFVQFAFCVISVMWKNVLTYISVSRCNQ